MISSLRREHVKRDTFQFIVKRLEDALRRMQKPIFDVDLEVMVRSVQFFHNTGRFAGGRESISEK